MVLMRVKKAGQNKLKTKMEAAKYELKTKMEARPNKSKAKMESEETGRDKMKTKMEMLSSFRADHIQEIVSIIYREEARRELKYHSNKLYYNQMSVG